MLLLDSLLCTIKLCVFFVPMPFWFGYHSFIIQFESRKHDVANFVLFFFFSISLAVWGVVPCKS